MEKIKNFVKEYYSFSVARCAICNLYYLNMFFCCVKFNFKVWEAHNTFLFSFKHIIHFIKSFNSRAFLPISQSYFYHNFMFFFNFKPYVSLSAAYIHLGIGSSIEAWKATHRSQYPLRKLICPTSAAINC